MEIHRLQLFSSYPERQKRFYTHLGFSPLSNDPNSFQLSAGATTLSFVKGPEVFHYHFAFLIPTGLLLRAIEYLGAKNIALLPYKGKDIIDFGSGRAIYFYDEDENIVEFIERPSLKYTATGKFSVEQIIGINEIGVPARDPISLARHLRDQYRVRMVDPELISDTFCWVGDYRGVFIVTRSGRPWLPTEVAGRINDFDIGFSSEGGNYELSFRDNEILPVRHP